MRNPAIRPLLLCVASALVLATTAAPASAQFGIAAGLNYEQMDDLDVGNLQGTFDAASGYHVGVFYDIGAGPIGLKIGAYYRDLGDVDFSLSGVEGVNLTMFDFPIDVRLNILPLPAVNPYLFAGPVLSIPRSDDEDLDESLESMFVAGAVGGGLQIGMGGLTLMPEFRYGIAITDLTGDSFRIAGQQFDASQGPRGNTVQLRLGLRF